VPPVGHDSAGALLCRSARPVGPHRSSRFSSPCVRQFVMSRLSSAADLGPLLTSSRPNRQRPPPRGPMAEWLRRGLQILARRFDSGSGLHLYPRSAPQLSDFGHECPHADANSCAILDHVQPGPKSWQCHRNFRARLAGLRAAGGANLLRRVKRISAESAIKVDQVGGGLESRLDQALLG
jgi:hypothetical protein